MALVKNGVGIAQISGKVGGVVFARNRTGNYMRNKTMPVNPRSALQVDLRTNLSSLTELWHTGLDAAKRIAWDSYAASITLKNRLGEDIHVTGFNMFVRTNSLRLQAGLLVIDDGPTSIALPAQDPGFTIDPTSGDQKLNITFTESAPWALSATSALMLFMGRPQLATRNFFNGPWQYAGKVLGVASTGAQSPAAIDAPFTLIDGQKVWCYARILDVDGSVSEPFRADGIVAAS